MYFLFQEIISQHFHNSFVFWEALIVLIMSLYFEPLQAFFIFNDLI